MLRHDPDDPPGRLLLWPTISPRGHTPPETTHYVTWPGWERHRVVNLGEAESYEGFVPLFVEEPPDFWAIITHLTGIFVEGEPILRFPPYFDQEEADILKEILAGESPIPPPLSRFRSHSLLAVWSTADSLRREKAARLALELGQNGLPAALDGESRHPAIPEAQEPPPYLTVAWLDLITPVRIRGDRLWSPIPGFRDGQQGHPRIQPPTGDY
jgi:hypothetical protein